LCGGWFPPRNAIDKDLPLWANGGFPQTNGEPGCTQDMQVCSCFCVTQVKTRQAALVLWHHFLSMSTCTTKKSLL